MPRRSSALVLLFILVVSGAPAHGQDEPPAPASFEEELAAASKALVPDLEELSKWCRESRLYASLDHVWRAILALDSDHREARRGLRYHRVGRDGWRQSASYRVPRNRNDELEPQFRGKLTRVLDGYRINVLGFLDRDDLTRERRREALTTLLQLDPTDATVRASIGEELIEGRWVLTESAATLERRHFIAFLAKASLDVAPESAVSEPTDAERAFPIDWNAGRQTDRVRVLGTTGVTEVERAARVTHAIGDYFRTVFRERRDHRPDYLIYMLLNSRQRDLLLGAIDGVDEKTSSLVRRADGGWLGRGNRLGEWSLDPQRRIDGAARQTLGTMLMDAFGIDGRHGWAWEGVGLYLTYHLVGTRKTFFFQGGGYTPKTQTALWQRLQLADVNWLEEGRRLLSKPNAPHLEFLLGKSVNNMRDEDLLFSYVLAAYLLEGRPKETPTILRRIGAGDHPVRVLEEELGRPLREIEGRLLRWLEETR
jgi:hypothetical protein